MDKSCFNYQQSLRLKEKEWEELCACCGSCCGAYDDPCRHLKENSNGKLHCEIYDRRFGTHRTVKGEEFDCVLVKQILHTHWKNDYLCIYKQYSKMPWKLITSKES